MSRESTPCLYEFCGNKTRSPTGYCHAHQSRGMARLSKGVTRVPESLSRIPKLVLSSQTSHPSEYSFLAPNPDFREVDEDGFPSDALRGSAYRSAASARGIDISSYKNGMTELALLRNEEQEYKRRMPGYNAVATEYTVWKALGFSPGRASWWQREYVPSPYIAALLEYKLGMDPENLDLSYYNTSIARRAATMEDEDVLEFINFISEVDTRTHGASTYGDIVDWYDDNWSVESATRHILAKHTISEANDIHTWEQIRDAINEDWADMVQQTDRFVAFRNSVNLRDPLRALSELRELGMDAQTAYSWVQSDFAQLTAMKTYAREGVSLEDAIRSERMKIISSTSTIAQEDTFWQNPRNTHLRDLLVEYICRDDANKFVLDLKDRRNPEMTKTFGILVSQTAAQLQEFSSISGFRGTDEEKDHFLIHWMDFCIVKRRYTPDVTFEERGVASKGLSRPLIRYGFTPEDGLLITQHNQRITNETLSKLREEVQNGTPLEWALAWGS